MATRVIHVEDHDSEISSGQPNPPTQADSQNPPTQADSQRVSDPIADEFAVAMAKLGNDSQQAPLAASTFEGMDAGHGQLQEPTETESGAEVGAMARLTTTPTAGADSPVTKGTANGGERVFEAAQQGAGRKPSCGRLGRDRYEQCMGAGMRAGKESSPCDGDG